MKASPCSDSAEFPGVKSGWKCRMQAYGGGRGSHYGFLFPAGVHAHLYQWIVLEVSCVGSLSPSDILSWGSLPFGSSLLTSSSSGKVGWEQTSLGPEEEGHHQWRNPPASTGGGRWGLSF